MSYIFTSESVTEGHPDKMCDQISDAILNEALKQDSDSRSAVECFITTNLLVIGGEMTTSAELNVKQIAKDVIKEIGYDSQDKGFNYKDCVIMDVIDQQSPDIYHGVFKGVTGAGDQGLMFGYACKQTKELMPAPIQLANQLAKELANLRKKDLSYLRPDGKVQVSFVYECKKPKYIDTILISTQHDDGITVEQITKDLTDNLIKPVVDPEYLSKETKIIVNPSGRFVIGGPNGDTGLTGRKIIVDTYGGWSRHGGGAFSGKDASKVDRSAAYMARYIAKNLVKANIADELEIQLSYGIGIAEPISINVDTFGTGKFSDQKIISIIKELFDLTPDGIIKELNLKAPVYKETGAYGHFGHDYRWERTDKVPSINRFLAK